MPTREEIELKERADRALRTSRPAEALSIYRALLRRVTVFEPGLYESWLEGALASYHALGRTREAGYVLFTLRRFADAEACFDKNTTPVEWALSVARQGRHREAAEVLLAAGNPALAALELDAAGDPAGARGSWERLLKHERLRDRPYETALVHFNWAESLRRSGETLAARRAAARTQELLESLADTFERRRQRERAFDCYGILLRLGRDHGSFENVSEGYLNAIRLLAADDQKFYVLQYYEDFLAYAVQGREWRAAAMLARDAAEYCGKSGLVYERHYRQRAAGLFAEAARQSIAQGGPTELAESALVAGIDVAAALGDLALCAEMYQTLAGLPLVQKRRERYAAFAAQMAGKGTRVPPGPSFPEYLRRTDAYQDVWRQDLIEWELDGQPVPVLAHIIVDRIDHAPFARAALRALLHCADEQTSLDDPGACADLAHALGAVQVYEVLRPLETLGLHPEARVRAAVMAAVSQVYCKRSFGLVRQGLADADDLVRQAALRALRALHFRDGLEPLSRIFRESADDAVKLASLDAVADIGTAEAIIFLVDVVRHERGLIAARATQRLRAF
ncbi:MAG TPA: HEAT repeat domain-containing protein, partial [Polyangia bacterium]